MVHPRKRPTRRAPGWNDDGGGVRGGRVEQLDLDSHHRVQPRSLCGAHEPNDSVQALMVRNGQPAQPKPHRPIDQLIWR
jgi:hypothetical protein